MVRHGVSSTTIDGPEGWVPIHSSAYGVCSSSEKSGLFADASRPTSEFEPTRPHGYVFTAARSGKRRLIAIPLGSVENGIPNGPPPPTGETSADEFGSGSTPDASAAGPASCARESGASCALASGSGSGGSDA